MAVRWWILLLAIALWTPAAPAQSLPELPPTAGPHPAPTTDAALSPTPDTSDPFDSAAAVITSIVEAPQETPKATRMQQFTALRPLTSDVSNIDLTLGEQRIRDLEGLGPAPGTDSDDENKSSGSAPDKPTVAWTGELQVDDVMVSQSQANRDDLGDLQDFTDFRRARLGAIGSLWANTIYRIEVDFAQEGRPSFLDVYGQFTDLAIVGNVRIGHFFEPFAISRLTSNRYQSFMERPLLDAFAPSRNLGVMAFDTYAEKRGTWQLGLFASETNDEGEEQTDQGGESITGRMTYLPFWDEASDGRYYMHLGGCFSVRRPSDETSRFGYWPGFRPGSFDNIVWPRWADTGLIDTNNVTLLDVEWAWVMGSVHVQAEYAANFVNQIGGPDLSFHAWYVETGWFLTGESRPYQQEMAIFNRVTPYESFFFTRTRDGIRCGRGAWQVVFRVDELNLNDENIQGGRMVDLSVGLNWYVNPYTRLYFNYVHSALAKGEPGNYGDLFGLRAQFEF